MKWTYCIKWIKYEKLKNLKYHILHVLLIFFLLFAASNDEKIFEEESTDIIRICGLINIMEKY